MRPTLYIANGLFSVSERAYNARLTEALEAAGYRVILPQRDGFDFATLQKEFAALLPEYLAVPACRVCIYLLDLGKYIEESEAIIATVDEPVESGALVEMQHAKSIGKLVIAVRTDMRSPYGSHQDTLGGLHSFVWNCATHFLRLDGTHEHNEGQLPDIERIMAHLSLVLATCRHDRSKHRFTRSSHAREILRRAEYLFEGLTNVKSQQAIETLADRYQRRREWLEKTIVPRRI